MEGTTANAERYLKMYSHFIQINLTDLNHNIISIVYYDKTAKRFNLKLLLLLGIFTPALPLLNNCRSPILQSEDMSYFLRLRVNKFVCFYYWWLYYKRRGKKNRINFFCSLIKFARNEKWYIYYSQLLLAREYPSGLEILMS